MTAKTHILGGILAGELVALATDAPARTAALITAAAALGSLIPDIDHRGSKISNASLGTRLTSFAVASLTHHRGAIHTPAFILACLLALCATSFAAWPPGFLLSVGAAAGMLSHLVLDTLNPSGIMWLWPLSKKRFHLLSVTTNSPLEWLVAGLLLAVVAWSVSALPEARSLLERFPFQA